MKKRRRRKVEGGFKTVDDYSRFILLEGFKGSIQIHYASLRRSLHDDIRFYLPQHIRWSEVKVSRYTEGSDTLRYFEGMQYGLSLAYDTLRLGIETLRPRVNVTRAVKQRLDEYGAAVGTPREELARLNLSILPNQLVRNERMKRKTTGQRLLRSQGVKLLLAAKEMTGQPYISDLASALGLSTTVTLRIARHLRKGGKIVGIKRTKRGEYIVLK